MLLHPSCSIDVLYSRISTNLDIDMLKGVLEALEVDSSLLLRSKSSTKSKQIAHRTTINVYTSLELLPYVVILFISVLIIILLLNSHHAG